MEELNNEKLNKEKDNENKKDKVNKEKDFNDVTKYELNDFEEELKKIFDKNLEFINDSLNKADNNEFNREVRDKNKESNNQEKEIYDQEINDIDNNSNNQNNNKINNLNHSLESLKTNNKLKSKRLTLNQENILNVLKQVIDPELNQDIVSLGFIKGIDYSQQQIHIKLQLTTPGCPLAFLIIDEIKQKLNEVFKIPVDVELVFDLGFDFDNM